MALDTTDTIKGLIYEGVAFTLDDGKDMLQARVDATNSCAYLFYQYDGTELPDISRLDTSNATSMNHMFDRCTNLTTLDLNHFDTSNVTGMNAMFQSCSSLTSLDVSSFDTSNVTDMYYMFYGCGSLTTLDLSNFDTSNVTIMNAMFQNCSSLTSLDLSSFNTSSVTNINNMFYGCRNLSTIQGSLDLYSATSISSISNMFSGTNVLTGVTLKNIRTTLQIGDGTSYGHLWELSYLINAVKELWDLSASTQRTLTIGSANLEKIANTYVKLITPTAEQIEADPYINNKLPCEVCESTDEGAMTLTAYAGLKNWVLA